MGPRNSAQFQGENLSKIQILMANEPENFKFDRKS